MYQRAIEVERDGKTIRGMVYAPKETGRYPCVLMLHGFTGHKVETGFMFTCLSRALNHRGIAAVTFDFINSGESDGRFEDMLATGELADAMRMTQWLLGQPFVDRSRLGLLGFSLGGLLAACTVGRSDVYRCLTLIAPTTVKNMQRHAGANAGGKMITFGPHTLNPKFFTDIDQLDPLADCTRNARPTLIIQGTGDEAVRPEVAREYAAAMDRASVPMTFHEITDADHGFNRPRWREELQAALIPFLAQHLT